MNTARRERLSHTLNQPCQQQGQGQQQMREMHDEPQQWAGPSGWRAASHRAMLQPSQVVASPAQSSFERRCRVWSMRRE